MKREILGVLLAFSASGVDAKTLYKCVVKGKTASYQSDPCPGAMAKVWDATPEPQPSNAELWPRSKSKGPIPLISRDSPGPMAAVVQHQWAQLFRFGSM